MAKVTKRDLLMPAPSDEVQPVVAAAGGPGHPGRSRAGAGTQGNRTYTNFTMAQVGYLRQHYAELPVTHFTERWGLSVTQVYRLAARHNIKRRAPNGQPVWR